MKTDELLQLALRRKSHRLDGYACIGDFHGGVFECDHVSPWTKSGCNVDAEIMIVGQDWSSKDVLGRHPPSRHVVRFGFDPKFPTNKNLDRLLERHFGFSRTECYLTNLFPFVKLGNASAGIPLTDLVWSAQQFTLHEIRIVTPRLVICLGQRSFLALMRAVDLKGSPNLDQAINSPFKFANSIIHCVAHTGALGMNNRGRDQVEKDWRRLAASMHIGQQQPT